MHTLKRQPREAFWTVGFYAADGKWLALADITSKADAMGLVCYLNGGPLLMTTQGRKEAGL